MDDNKGEMKRLTAKKEKESLIIKHGRERECQGEDIGSKAETVRINKVKRLKELRKKKVWE